VVLGVPGYFVLAAIANAFPLGDVIMCESLASTCSFAQDDALWAELAAGSVSTTVTEDGTPSVR
jgi:hypothetical protein